MSFRVVWTEAARDELAEVWLGHYDQKGVTAATYRVDTVLARDPHGQGESREEDERRIMFDSPLVVIYSIDEIAGEVVVSHVRSY